MVQVQERGASQIATAGNRKSAPAEAGATQGEKES